VRLAALRRGLSQAETGQLLADCDRETAADLRGLSGPVAASPARAPCRCRLGMTCRLLGEILGVHESVISVAVSRVTPVLEPHGITPPPSAPASPPWPGSATTPPPAASP
jgi:hypothetical protein